MPKRKAATTDSSVSSKRLERKSKQDDEGESENSSCCIRVTASSHDESNDADSLLQQLLGPLSKDIFMSQYFQSKAVHVSSSCTLHFQELIEELSDSERILRETSSESIFVWLPSKSQSSQIKSIEISDPDAAYALLQAGHATYCRAPPHMEASLVRRLLQDTQLGCGYQHSALARGEVEVFIGATPGQVTGWHTDFQENFTIQLTGSKQWELKSSKIKHPLRGVTPHYSSPEMVEPQLKAARLADSDFQFDHPNESNSQGEIETVVLKPGDVLYHPAGIWHRVKVLEPGISINISLMASNYATLVCQSLQHYLLQQPAWRQNIRGAAPLEHLLSELPVLIRQFVQETGPSAILPSVIQQGGINESSDDDESRDEESETSSNDDLIMEADSFEKNRSWETLQEQNYLAINPLALILDQREIRKFYEGRMTETSSDESVKVLNVNFAGNENHESLLRVCFRTRYYDVVQDFLTKRRAGLSSEAIPLVDFLIYYGYLVPKLK